MPNRIIKESICSSETIDQMSWFEECFFHRLWTVCDDYGRTDARPVILKAKLFPLKERLSLKDIQNALQKMVDIGCVRLYECDSKPYLYLPSWEVHQQVRAKKSKYPAPDESCNHTISADIKCTRNPIQSESNPNPNPNARIDAPARVKPPSLEQVMEVAKLRGCPECAKPFFDYYAAAGWRDGEGKPVFNWQQKFVLWQMREENRRMPQSKASPRSFADIAAEMEGSL